MIKHIVFWKLKEHAEGASKEENAKKIKKCLEELKLEIPQIKHLEVGFNYNYAENEFDIALYSEFDSKDDLETYQKHPKHLKAGEFVGKVRDKRIAVDYEI